MCSALGDVRLVPIAAILMFYSITSSRRLFTISSRLPCGTAGNARRLIRAAGDFRTVWSVATLSVQKAEEGLLAYSSDKNGSAPDDTVVQKNCSRSASTAPQRQLRGGRRFYRICHRHLSSSNFSASRNRESNMFGKSNGNAADTNRDLSSAQEVKRSMATWRRLRRQRRPPPSVPAFRLSARLLATGGWRF